MKSVSHGFDRAPGPFPGLLELVYCRLIHHSRSVWLRAFKQESNFLFLATFGKTPINYHLKIFEWLLKPQIRFSSFPIVFENPVFGFPVPLRFRGPTIEIKAVVDGDESIGERGGFFGLGVGAGEFFEADVAEVAFGAF